MSERGSPLQKQMMVLIVWLILNGKVERAVEFLSAQFDVSVPKTRVGLPKGRKNKALGCYSARDRTISVLDSDTLKDPFVILHEFHHHLRTAADRDTKEPKAAGSYGEVLPRIQKAGATKTKLLTPP